MLSFGVIISSTIMQRSEILEGLTNYHVYMYIYIYIYINEEITHDICMYILGVTGGTDQTSGECSLGHTIPI